MTLKILDVGCGKNKFPTAMGIDNSNHSDADIIHDLNQTPWPLEENYFDQIRCMAILEHVRDFFPVMKEIHRVGKNGAAVIISVPHYTDTAAYTDPTHCIHFNSFSFDTLLGNSQWSFYAQSTYRKTASDIRLLNLWRYLGFEFLINNAKICQRFWEHYLCFIVRGKTINLTLEIVK